MVGNNLVLGLLEVKIKREIVFTDIWTNRNSSPLRKIRFFWFILWCSSCCCLGIEHYQIIHRILRRSSASSYFLLSHYLHLWGHYYEKLTSSLCIFAPMPRRENVTRSLLDNHLHHLVRCVAEGWKRHKPNLAPRNSITKGTEGVSIRMA